MMKYFISIENSSSWERPKSLKAESDNEALKKALKIYGDNLISIQRENYPGWKILYNKFWKRNQK